MKACRSNVTLAARGTPSTQVLVCNTILQRNGLILGLRQEIYKLSLEHLVTESKKVLKTKQNKTPKETKKPPQLWEYKGTRGPTARAPSGQSWSNSSKKIQLTLKQHRCELHLSTYKPIFFSVVNNTVLRNLWLVKPGIQRADTGIFTRSEGQHP